MSCKILGIDPGSRITGYGVIEIIQNRICYIDSGCIRVIPQTLGNNLLQIYQGIEKIIKKYQPDEVAIEKVFMAKNPDSALKLGQARAAAIVAVTQLQLPLSEYSAKQAKKALVSYGQADKLQVQQMISRFFKLEVLPPSDAADALAIAWCHAGVLNQKIKTKALATNYTISTTFSKRTNHKRSWTQWVENQQRLKENKS